MAQSSAIAQMKKSVPMVTRAATEKEEFLFMEAFLSLGPRKILKFGGQFLIANS
jgi:hypothetical protein